jgi:hypothetical protein
MKVTLISAVALCASLCASFPCLAAQCAPANSTSQVAQTARDLFAATQALDAGKFKALITADFYAYDGGKRFDGLALLDLIKDAKGQGRRFEWTVQDTVVHIDCRTATLVYVNRGAVGDAKAMTPMTWLESDMLRWENGRWKIAFLHSTRAPQ